MELGMKILFKLQCIPLHSFFFLNTIHNVRTPFSLCVARHTHFATTKNEERKMRKNYFLAPLHKHKKKTQQWREVRYILYKAEFS